MADNIESVIRAQCEAVASRLDAQGLKKCKGCPEKVWKVREGLCPDCYERKEKDQRQGEDRRKVERREKERRDIDG